MGIVVLYYMSRPERTCHPLWSLELVLPLGVRTNEIPGPSNIWFRNLILPLFLKARTNSRGSVYSYRADWD
jgi:hypothetical protein